MKITINQLRKLIKDVINDMSPIGVGSPENQVQDEDDSYNFVSDPIIKKLVFDHLQAMGSIDINEKIGGFAWNQLEIWEIPYNTDPNAREFSGSITHNGKRYYGEY